MPCSAAVTSPEPPASDEAARTRAIGLGYGLAAYVTWGILPLYFKLLREVPALQTLAHRIVWATVLLAAVITWRRSWRSGYDDLRRAGAWRFIPTTLLLSCNWLVYIWSVNSGRVLEASLGYFVTPLVNVGLGVWVLHERLSRAAGIAVAIAAVGVAVLVFGTGTLPWIPFALAGSFGTYGLLRKRIAVAPVPALLVETALMVPLAAGYLLWLPAEAAAFGVTPWIDGLLLASGAVTAFPLIWFGHAARRVQLATLGALQYLSPSMSFVMAVTLFGEPFGLWHAIAFALIWTSLAVFGLDAARRR